MIPRKKSWCTIPVSVQWRSTGQFRDLRIWLLDNISADNYEFGGLGHDPFTDHRVYYFAREQDATLFSLRWV